MTESIKTLKTRLKEGLGLTEAHFSNNGCDLLILNTLDVRIWLQENYQFPDNTHTNGEYIVAPYTYDEHFDKAETF